MNQRKKLTLTLPLLTAAMSLSACSQGTTSAKGSSAVSQPDSAPKNQPGTLVATATGSGHSGGADLSSPDADAAWFEELKTVKYCIAWDSTFGVDAQIVDQEFQKAVHQWADYIVQWKINQSAQLPSGYGVSADFQSQGECTGNEDLKIYAGVSNDETSHDLSFLDHPVAFARREPHKLGQSWGRGYIWLSLPFQSDYQELSWQNPYALQGAFLHELGHVLGNEHIEGTIMREDVGNDIIRDKTWVQMSSIDVAMRERRLTQINQNRILSGSADVYRQLTFHGSIGSDVGPLSDYQKAIFKRFVGREEAGDFQASAQYDGANLKITFTDSVGSESVLVQVIENEDGNSPGTRKSFITYAQAPCPRCPQGLGFFSHFILSGGDTTLGVVKAATGENVTVEVAYNQAGSPLRIGLPDNGVITTLFLASSVEVGNSNEEQK